MTMVLWGSTKDQKVKKQTFLDAKHKKVIQYGNNMKKCNISLRNVAFFI